MELHQRTVKILLVKFGTPWKTKKNGHKMSGEVINPEYLSSANSQM